MLAAQRRRSKARRQECLTAAACCGDRFLKRVCNLIVRRLATAELVAPAPSDGAISSATKLCRQGDGGGGGVGDTSSPAWKFRGEHCGITAKM